MTTMLGASERPVLDAQVHVWRAPCDEYPWGPTVPGDYFETQVPSHSFERVVEDMDACGIDGAIAVVPRLYGVDNRYALDAAARHPDRIAVVGRIDCDAPGHLERLRAFAAQPGVVGLKLPRSSAGDWAADGAFAPMLHAAETVGVPLCVMPGPHSLGVLADVAARHERLVLLVDHLGMQAVPQTVPTPGPEPFDRLADLLALARHPNIKVKLTAAPCLSNMAFPFEDVHEPVLRIIERFGIDRVLWGSDYSRVSALFSYEEGLNYVGELGLSDEELSSVLFRNSQRTFDWAPGIVWKHNGNREFGVNGASRTSTQVAGRHRSTRH